MKFRPTDAFVDESIRGQRYVMGCVLVEARQLSVLRRVMGELAVTTSRIHFNNESTVQKRRVLDAIAGMPIQAFATLCRKGHEVDEFRARAASVAEIVRQLQRREVVSLVLESRQDDSDDQRVISRTRAREPFMLFEHRSGKHERMLWIADALTWAVAAGPPWTGRIGPVLTEVIEIRP